MNFFNAQFWKTPKPAPNDSPVKSVGKPWIIGAWAIDVIAIGCPIWIYHANRSVTITLILYGVLIIMAGYFAWLLRNRFNQLETKPVRWYQVLFMYAAGGALIAINLMNVTSMQPTTSASPVTNGRCPNQHYYTPAATTHAALGSDAYSPAADSGKACAPMMKGNCPAKVK